MSKIVFIGWSAAGTFNPTLSIVHELVLRGEEVVYIAGPECKKPVEAAGATYLNDARFSLLYNLSRPKASRQTRTVYEKISEIKFYENLADFYKMLPYLLTLMEKFKKTIIDLNPSCIIHDSGLSYIKYICRDLKIPCVSSVSMFAFNREMFFENPLYFSYLYNIKVESDFSKIVNNVEEIAERYGIDTTKGFDIFDEYLGKENLNIVYTSPEFQPYSEILDESYHFTGNNLDFRKSFENSTFFEIQNNQKCVLVSFGSQLSSNATNGKFYRDFMEYFKKYPALFIINIGEISSETFDNTPNNFILKNGINQIEILKYADIFITHGGMNSVSESIQNNTPVIVLPQMTDQFIVAEQVENTKIGIKFNGDDFDFEMLEHGITSILNDLSYKEKIAYIAETYKATGEASRTVSVILDYQNNSL